MMKKMIFSAGIILALLTSCETQDELTIMTAQPKPDSIKITQPDSVVNKDSVSLPIMQADGYALSTNEDKFNVIYRQSFLKNTVGSYKESEWRTDWNDPSWANHKYGYGKIMQDGTNKYLAETFVAGSFQASGGYQWHGKFTQAYNELYFSFKIKFSSGFSNRNLNGKLPGLSGGASNGGGNLPTGKDGWSARYMFHGTEIKFYLYYPDLFKVYGDSKPVSGKMYYGNGPTLSPGYVLKPEVWYTVTQRIVMNTPGKANGLVEGFINGKLCASQTGIRFRDISSLQIDRIYFANFFGGSGVPPSKSEAVSFDDFVVYTYKSNVSIARNNVSNSSGASIVLPNLPN